MNELNANKELLDSPNYYEVIPSGEPCNKENSLYLTIDQKRFNKIVSGEKTVEYREITEATASRYLDMRESSEGYQLYNPNLPEEANYYFEANNEGIYAYTPRYYEYLRLGLGYNKDRDTAIIRIKGNGLVPEMYHKGGVMRTNPLDESITEEMYQKATQKGDKATQEFFYKPDGKETFGHWQYT